MLIVQHSSGLDDLQILVPSVLHSDSDLQVRHGCDFVGGGRERDLETTGGAEVGLGVSTDGGKAKGNKRQKEHGE